MCILSSHEISIAGLHEKAKKVKFHNGKIKTDHDSAFISLKSLLVWFLLKLYADDQHQLY
jgi:hypothetical protein